MAHVLSLVYGSTTIALASGDYRIISYPIQAPEEGAASVIEQAVIEVTGSTIAAMQTDVQAITKAFAAAKKRRTGKSWTRLFVNFQPDGYTTAYRSEILSGRLLVPETALQADWANKRVEVTLIWERLPFWEAVDWTAVALSNTNGTNNTSGLRVYNCADGSGASPNDRVNYATIAAASVAGDLPGPVKLVMTPEVVSVHRIYIGLYVDEAGLGIPPMMFESTAWSKDGDSGGTLTTTADSGCSGGSYANLVAHAEGDAWLVASVTMSAFKGSWLRPIVRLFDSHSGEKFTLQFKIGNVVVSEAAGAIIPDSRLVQPLGMIRIPPYPYLASTPTGTLLLRMDGFGVWLKAAMNLDALFFLGADGYAEIGRDDTEAVDTSQQFVETWDIDALSYVQESADASAQYRYANIKTGSGIFLTPGKDQRLDFLMRNGSGDYVTSAMLVQCFYKPRRVAL